MSDSGPSVTLEHHRPSPDEKGEGHLLLIAPGPVFVFPLPSSPQIVIGRKDAEICVDDRTVSRRHALLRLQPVPTLRDLGSSNGTYLNGRRLAAEEEAPVIPGSTIEVGAALFVFQSGRRERGPLHDPGRMEAPAAVEEERAELAPGDRAMRQLHRVLERVAPSDISVLFTGETGVGKGRLAMEIHQGSRRAQGPFVPLNCAAFPDTLFESEMFGHEKGAFTGAVRAKEGLLENAGGGTVFLDEVGEMPFPMQAKLLHVLEERQVLRLGGLKALPLDVRFISATNQDLEARVAAGTFRRDLYFRLNGVSVRVPPLRERPRELRDLASTFVIEAAARSATPAPTIDPSTYDVLLRHPWPGNVRELRNVMERAVVFSAEGKILPSHLDLAGTTAMNPEERERKEILEALERCAGNQSRAARLLGYSRQTLVAKLDRHQIPRPRKRMG